MMTDTVDHAAVGAFLAGATGATEAQIRAVLVRMTAQMAGNERPMGPNGRVGLATMHAVVDGLRALLPA